MVKTESIKDHSGHQRKCETHIEIPVHNYSDVRENRVPSNRYIYLATTYCNAKICIGTKFSCSSN